MCRTRVIARGRVAVARRAGRLPGWRVGTLIAVWFAAATSVIAQTPPGIVAGVVRDESGRALPGANVVLDPDQTPRFAVTNAEGRFRFSGVPRGQHILRVLRLGFRAEDRGINMGNEGAELTIVLHRVTTALDTLRVVARRTGLFGTVIGRAEFRPMAGANVRVASTRQAARTGADGRFDFPALLSGAYVVFASGAGFQTEMLPVTVAADSATEIALLLDSASAPGGKRYAMPMAEFESRSTWIGNNSAVIVRQELAGREGMGVGDALRYSLTFLRKGLVLDDRKACVYIDGLPAPNTTANDVQVADVEAIEVYGLRADYTNTLARRWPRYTSCGSSQPVGLQGGLHSRAPMDPFVRAIVIWLKR